MNTQKSFLLATILLAASLLACNKQHSTETTEWFAFTPSNTLETGILDMNHWLDAPAGKHGFVTMQDEHLRFENGEIVKFWGTNVCSRLPFVEAEKADSFARFFARYGINAVRFHKFTWYAYDGDHSTRFNKELFDRFDYFQHALRERGIYYGWSHIYGHRVQPADSMHVLAYQEIRDLSFPWRHLNGSTAGLVNFAPDLQELNIALTVDMLNHVNPYTGLRYADDPALAFIEFQNEDNIFWSAIERALEQAPTYRALLCRQFSDWLKDRYGSQEALVVAWGHENIPQGESLAKRNIYPQPNHGLFSWAYETALEENRPMATHILDKMRFLYEKQVEFYLKFKKAVRETGYKGVLIASCWQAGSGISHFYNLHADYLTGMIDRHNYFGGGAGGHGIQPGFVRNNAMLADPGSGLFSAGVQQVVDRPFAFSEWMSLVPNQWTAEAAPIIAVYGMGLQGWDASFSFAADIPRYSPYLQSEHHGVYNATSPLHIGLYPALARMIYRNDIRESPVMATRKVHVPSMEEGILGFEETVDQGFDDKRFSGSVPTQTLAIGRIPVQFTEELEETIVPDLTAYWDTINKKVASKTGELEWMYGDNPFFTINSAGTKGVVGFLTDEKIMLDDWAVQSDNPFAVIMLTSLEKGKTLATADSILITTVARAKNTGMEYNEAGDTLITVGTRPLLLEPINVAITPPRRMRYKVEILDHDGMPTGRSVATGRGTFHLHGARNETMFYLLTR